MLNIKTKKSKIEKFYSIIMNVSTMPYHEYKSLLPEV